MGLRVGRNKETMNKIYTFLDVVFWQWFVKLGGGVKILIWESNDAKD